MARSFIKGGLGLRILICAHPDALGVFKSKVVSSSYMRDVDGGAFGESSIVQDGKVHQRMRAVLNGPFTPRGLAAAEIGPRVAEIIERRVRRFAGREPIAVLAATREISLEIIFRLIGIEDGDFSTWRKRYQQTTLLLLNVPTMVPGSPRWWGSRAKRWIDARLSEHVHAERAREPGRGLLSRSYTARAKPARRSPTTRSSITCVSFCWLVMRRAPRPWPGLRDSWRSRPTLGRASPKKCERSAAFPRTPASSESCLSPKPCSAKPCVSIRPCRSTRA